jgi:hypothetical protein
MEGFIMTTKFAGLTLAAAVFAGPSFADDTISTAADLIEAQKLTTCFHAIEALGPREGMTITDSKGVPSAFISVEKISDDPIKAANECAGYMTQGSVISPTFMPLPQ